MKDGKTWHDLVNEVVLSREQLVYNRLENKC